MDLYASPIDGIQAASARIQKALGCSDIIAGIHSDIDTVLVLSGVTSEEDLKHFAYHPRYILSGVGEIPG